MEQPSLFAFFGGSADPEARVERGRDWAFVDLFCGIGGASQGASEAGHKVVLAVDSCPKALKVHEANHPHTEHVCATLPTPEPLPLPTSGAWHLHGSPPCTKLSQLNKLERDSEATMQGLQMVRWYLEFALASGATSWTMEQVDMPEVRAVVEELMAHGSPHRGKLDYQVVDMSELGVPQQRKRLLAGTPALIARLRRLSHVRRGVSDAIPAVRGTHTKNAGITKSVRRWKDAYGRVIKKGYHIHTGYEITRPVRLPGYTITTAGGRWCSPAKGDQTKFMTVAEAAALQTFPPTYAMHTSRTVAMRGVGNAVPPLLMRRLLGGPVDLPQQASDPALRPPSPPSPSLTRRPATA